MTMIPLVRPWIEQPQTAPLPRQSAVFAWVGSEPVNAHQSGIADVYTTPRTGKLGVGQYSDGASNVVSMAHVRIPAARIQVGAGRPWTFFLSTEVLDSSVGLTLLAGLGRPSAGTLAFLLRGNNAGNLEVAAFSGGWVSATWTGEAIGNGVHRLAVQHDGSATMRVSVDGRVLSDKAFASSAFPSSVAGESLLIGAACASTTSNNLWGTQAAHVAAGWIADAVPRSVLSDATRSDAGFYDAIFEPRRIYVPFAAAAGGTPTLTDPGWLVSGNQLTPRGNYAF